MKKIINKIKKILNYDVEPLINKLKLGEIFLNVVEFICNKIIYNIYRFTLEPLITLITTFFTSYRKTKIAIIIWMLSFNFFYTIGASFSLGFNGETGFSSYNYEKDSKIISEEKLADEMIKIKHYYQSSSLEGCKIEYEKSLSYIEKKYRNLSIKSNKCSLKPTNNYYNYEIIAEANYFYTFIYGIGSLIKSVSYYFGGLAIVIGTIIISPLLYLANK